jgi:hypothetical protein
MEIHTEQKAITFHQSINTHLTSLFYFRSQKGSLPRDRRDKELIIASDTNLRRHGNKIQSISIDVGRKDCKVRSKEERFETRAFKVPNALSSFPVPFFLEFLLDEILLRSYEESTKKSLKFERTCEERSRLIDRDGNDSARMHRIKLINIIIHAFEKARENTLSLL